MVLVAGLCSSSAESRSNLVAAVNAPPLPPVSSPVDVFRELLAMRPEEREAALSNRTAEVRARLLAKAREYDMLPADERELRLRATELRWYLGWLMRLPMEQRPRLEEVVPSHLRQAVSDRLALWDRLPAEVRSEFLNDDTALNYFSRVPAPGTEYGTGGRAWFVTARTDDWGGIQTDAEAKRPGADEEPEFREGLRALRRLFDWTPEERQKALASLTEVERRQMEASLRQYEKLSPEQRRLVIASFERLARMTPEERREFLRNAERWSAMSPSERERWRRLVREVPELPPLPPGFYEVTPPPLPPGIEKTSMDAGGR
ncbi:MAG: DUF3106 domain-containing protein [Verrucomicrobiota bacterium]|nr:DUF3106 domain-containing protein [Limisphaera sp.]MDW8382558.1 DUF3106 domain-containing protein [Verrucomicrobiota bacterium]